MTFAYADPPYPGQSRRHYKDHPDFAGEVDHRQLLDMLYETYPDGWALSSSMKGLWTIVPMIPLDWKCRVAAWVKPYVGTPFMALRRPQYAWEPVIFRGGRERDGHRLVRDWVMTSNLSGQKGRKSRNGRAVGAGLAGAKPDEFCYWLFELLNMKPGDVLEDVFPGTGRVSRAWEAYQTAGMELFA